jgi:quinol monooxygenase YgiN
VHSAKVHFVVSLEIEPSKLSEFERIAETMCEVSRQEPGTLAYDWFMDAERAHCRLLETYVDAAAMVAHLQGQAVQVYVPRMLECSRITNFEVFGTPGAEGNAVLAKVGAKFFAPWLAARS